MNYQRVLVGAALITALGMGCGDDGGTTDGGVDSGMMDSGSDAATDAPAPVTGCTNATASNYDAAANIEDGSCLFAVSFSVDMAGVEGFDRADGVLVQGDFCSDDCPTLSDGDEDDIWEGSVDLAQGTYRANFAIGSDPRVVETVPEACRAEGDTTRVEVTVVDAPVMTPTVGFGACTRLPMAVDGFYSAAGFFELDAANITGVPDACPTRPDDARGACWTWTYERGTQGFAGVFWQYVMSGTDNEPVDQNFGEDPGFPVPPGATRVSFYAWGETGGEVVRFEAGYGAAGENPRDGFSASSPEITLTDSPTQYSISLVGVDYDTIAGAFAWIVALPEGVDSTTFYIDDIVYERVAADLENVPGCMDDDAANFNEEATMDDGSCLYTVTFNVDTGCPDPDHAITAVLVTGPFCEWCADGPPLTDPDMDGVFTGTGDFPAGAFEFKFISNGNFDNQENLIDDVAGGMGACAPVTDGMNYANRQITIDAAPTVVDAAYGRCTTCD